MSSTSLPTVPDAKLQIPKIKISLSDLSLPLASFAFHPYPPISFAQHLLGFILLGIVFAETRGS